MVPVVEEVPSLSDDRRAALQRALAQAQQEIAAGDFDILTAQVLRAEFEGIFQDDLDDEALDAVLAKEIRQAR